MAFYSVRVDEEGKEIETSRRTFRKLCLGSLDKSSNSARSSNPEENISPTENAANNYKTVRYVNSATFIEKDMKTKKQTAEQTTNENEKEADSNSCRSGNSDEVPDSKYQTHISAECDAIPFLELNSNESFPSSNTMSYSYRKVCEVTKMIQKPDAYKEWLDAKKTAKYYEQKKKLDKEKEEEEKKEQRRSMAHKKYKEWVTRKNKQKLEKQLQQMKIGNDLELAEPEQPCNKEDRLAREKNYRAWLKKKLKEEKELKEKVNEELKLEMQLDQIRREKASEIYREWLQTAVHKPKPVPLNRGLFTLKGSVSSLYINPISWAPLENAEESRNL